MGTRTRTRKLLRIIHTNSGNSDVGEVPRRADLPSSIRYKGDRPTEDHFSGMQNMRT